MADGVKGGAAAVLGQVRPHEVPPVEEAEQLDLLGLPATTAGTAVAERRGPGRPLGSVNRRTTQWAEFLLARYASPLEVLAQMAVAPVDTLKSQLGCSALEAMQEKRHAATALLPFLHQRMPLAVDVSTRKIVHLTIVESDEATEHSIAAEIVDVVVNQQVSGGEDDAL